jgi:hypothetical protein
LWWCGKVEGKIERKEGRAPSYTCLSRSDYVNPPSSSAKADPGRLDVRLSVLLTGL